MSQSGVSSIAAVIGIPVTVPNGGTGVSSFTPYAVITGGITNTDPLQSVASLGTSGQFLTSNGPGALPSFTTGVASVSGTANRITSTGGANPIIDISAAYVGQTSITTLGTITTGTWSGTVIGVTKGGTGLSTVAQGDILYASASNTLSSLAKNTTATRYLANTGITNNPNWDQVNLANGVTGNLPVTNLNSGTSASATTFWRGDATWATPTSGIATVTGQIFTSSGAFTYTPTSGMKYVIVELVGGGGGSGGCAIGGGNVGASGAGGGGAYARFILTAAQVGVSLSGSVGAGGTAGASGANNGGDGGNTTLATTSSWTAGGGKGGSGITATAGSSTAAGGAGGTMTTGTGTILANIPGSAGSYGTQISTGGGYISIPGVGGSSQLSGSTVGTVRTTNGNTAGVAGVTYGAGAYGAATINSTDVAGAAGAIGVAIFTEYV